MTADELIAFEQDIAAEFEAGRIAAPVHLAGGNEQHLINIFKQIKDYDYICCQWRSHYHALLKGVPPAILKQAILDGRSIALAFPEYKMISSAIVGGIAPIAVGIAAGLKRRQERGTVWVFLGDMTAMTGIVHEALTYATGHRLPIMFVIEDNGMSVCTATAQCWGNTIDDKFDGEYEYKLTFPHVGTGVWVSF